MTRPTSILWFERCYLGSVGIGLVNSALSWSAIRAQVDATPGAAVLPASFLVGMLVVGLIVNLLLWYFTALRGSAVGKWIIVAFFAMGLLGVARTLVGGVAAPTSNALVGIALLLQAVAIWMLFRPDAKAWFADDRRQDLTDTFS